MVAKVVGLDIGTSSIKATQSKMVKTKDGVKFEVEKVATRPLSLGWVREGLIREEHAPSVTEAIKDLWKSGGFSTKDVVLGINNSQSVFSRVADIPWRTPEDLASSLRFEVQHNRLLPLSADDVEIDAIPIGEPLDEETGQQMLRVFIIAASQKSVSQNIKVVESAGLSVSNVDINPFGSLRAMKIANHEQLFVDVTIDMGADSMTVFIHRNGMPQYLHISPDDSGHGMTRFIQKELGLPTFQDAENAKIGAHRGSPVDEPIDKIVRKTIQNIQNIIQHFMRDNPWVQGVSSFTLLGGASQLVGLADQLEQSLNVPVGPVRPVDELVFKNGESTLQSSDVDVSVSAGLSMGTRF